MSGMGGTKILLHPFVPKRHLVKLSQQQVLLQTVREGNVFTCICDSVHNQPHGYSITAHPCWLLGLSSSLLQCGRYV